MIPWSCKAISEAGFVAVNTMGVNSNESCLFKWNEFLRNYGEFAKVPMEALLQKVMMGLSSEV